MVQDQDWQSTLNQNTDTDSRKDGGNKEERSHQPDRRRWKRLGYEAGGSKPSVVETIQGHKATQPIVTLSQEPMIMKTFAGTAGANYDFLRREATEFAL